MGTRSRKKQSSKNVIQRLEKRDDLVFKALANKDRRRILDLVREMPLTTGDLCQSFPSLNRCTVMLHLGKLEEAELIIVRRDGKFRWNYLNVEPVQQIYNRWIKGYAQPAANLLTRLKTQLESDVPQPKALP